MTLPYDEEPEQDWPDCPVCGSNSLFDGDDPQFIRCLACGAAFFTDDRVLR